MDLVDVGVGEANDVPVVHDEGGVPHVGRSSRLRTVIPVQRDEADPRPAFLSAACKPAVHRPGRVVFDGRVILAALEAASLRGLRHSQATTKTAGLLHGEEQHWR